MKTTMKQLAAGTILALLLITVNVHAEGKEASKASSLGNVEATLQLENWMMDDNFWDTAASFNLAEETDDVLQLEDWMTNNESWENAQNAEIKTENESSLQLEDWMTNETNFNVSKNVNSPENFIHEENAQKLKLESWMLNENYWGK